MLGMGLMVSTGVISAAGCVVLLMLLLLPKSGLLISSTLLFAVPGWVCCPSAGYRNADIAQGVVMQVTRMSYIYE